MFLNRNKQVTFILLTLLLILSIYVLFYQKKSFSLVSKKDLLLNVFIQDSKKFMLLFPISCLEKLLLLSCLKISPIFTTIMFTKPFRGRVVKGDDTYIDKLNPSLSQSP